MKALIINGSPHKNGATAKALQLGIDTIKEHYHPEYVHAYDLRIKPCLGCMKCRPDKECILPKDDGHALGDKLKDAELLVIGTPSYWSNMPAPLKVIFDRNVAVLEYCLDKPPVPNMVGKKALLFVTCASDEQRSDDALQLPLLIANMHYILKSSGYDIIGTHKIHSSWNFEQHEASLQETLSTIDF